MRELIISSLKELTEEKVNKIPRLPTEGELKERVRKRVEEELKKLVEEGIVVECGMTVNKDPFLLIKRLI